MKNCYSINESKLRTYKSRFIRWTASSEFGTYRLCEQRRFRRACASAQSRQNLRYSLIQAVSQEGPSDRKPDLRPLWMAGHAQLKLVMTECSKTQIRLTGLRWNKTSTQKQTNSETLELQKSNGWTPVGQTKDTSPGPSQLNRKLYAGAIIKSEARPTGVQLKRSAKLLIRKIAC